MSISLNKKTGINLSKGSRISLEKEGSALQNICIGINWGKIKKKSFFGLLSSDESVDLDGSVALYDGNNRYLETIYFKNLTSSDGAIRHSGDDRSGDSVEDDYDNEVIEISLSKLSMQVAKMVFFINSYLGQDFADIPYSKIRIYEGTPQDIRQVLATFNLSAEAAFGGHTAMLMGKMWRKENGKWDFKALGEPLRAPNISETLQKIEAHFLD
ncbi:TerD family protein [Hugenholtzia roseola]|uniref:TerD family protein n=1 Tax=Hugenholtzia roseola TaxID=1002 RepID=UPI000400C0F0|nr:TerD family protein [Hugenholtzia roseola]